MFGFFERGKGSGSFTTILLLVVLAILFFTQNSNRRPMRSGTAATNKDDQDTVEKDKATILYSRVLGNAEIIPEKRVLEAIVKQKPESRAKVLFSRKVGKPAEEEKLYNVLYSRSLGIPEN